MHPFIIRFCFFYFLIFYDAQTYQAIRQNHKFRLLLNNQLFSNDWYDSIILPNAFNPYCVLCNKKEIFTSSFILTRTKKWFCRYLLPSTGKFLYIDTMHMFSLPFDTISVVYDNKTYYRLKYEKKYFLIDEDFKSIFNSPYSAVYPILDKKWFIITDIKEDGIRRAFVVDVYGNYLIEPRFSSIKYNGLDSVFIACSGNYGQNNPDEIIDLNGKTIYKNYMHILDGNKKYAIIFSVNNEVGYKIVDISTQREAKFKSEEPPVLRDSLIKITSKGKTEIYTFEKLSKIQGK